MIARGTSDPRFTLWHDGASTSPYGESARAFENWVRQQVPQDTMTTTTSYDPPDLEGTVSVSMSFGGVIK
jgi:hypothetical protein